MFSRRFCRLLQSHRLQLRRRLLCCGALSDYPSRLHLFACCGGCRFFGRPSLPRCRRSLLLLLAERLCGCHCFGLGLGVGRCLGLRFRRLLQCHTLRRSLLIRHPDLLLLGFFGKLCPLLSLTSLGLGNHRLLAFLRRGCCCCRRRRLFCCPLRRRLRLLTRELLLLCLAPNEGFRREASLFGFTSGSLNTLSLLLLSRKFRLHGRLLCAPSGLFLSLPGRGLLFLATLHLSLRSSLFCLGLLSGSGLFCHLLLQRLACCHLFCYPLRRSCLRRLTRCCLPGGPLLLLLLCCFLLGELRRTFSRSGLLSLAALVSKVGGT